MLSQDAEKLIRALAVSGAGVEVENYQFGATVRINAHTVLINYCIIDVDDNGDITALVNPYLDSHLKELAYRLYARHKLTYKLSKEGGAWVLRLEGVVYGKSIDRVVTGSSLPALLLETYIRMIVDAQSV